MINKEINTTVICPDCLGDGIETCHNPDHGFLSLIGNFTTANESACPCCGHSKDHKIVKFIGFKDGKPMFHKNKCETCNGSGQVPIDIFESYVSEFIPEEYVDQINEICLNQPNNDTKRDIQV